MRRILAPLLLLAAGWSHAIADNGADILTLETALSQALESNPMLLSAEAQAQQADARLKQAKGSLWPQLNLNYYYNKSDDPLDVFAARLKTRSVEAANLTPPELNEPDEATLKTTRLGLNWPLYTGGQRLAGVAGARAMRNASQHSYRYNRALLHYQVTAAYRGLQATTEGLRIAGDAVTAADTHVKTTRRLSRAGRIIKSDRLTAEVYLSRMQGGLEQARLQQQQARYQLTSLTNTDTTQKSRLSDWSWPSTRQPDDVQVLLSQALNQRADLKAASAQTEAARANVQKSRGKLHPQIGIVANRDRNDSDFGNGDSKSAGAYVQLNLFSGGSDYYGIKAQKLSLIQAEQQLKQQRLRIKQEVRTAVSQQQIAARRLQIARASIAQASDAVARVKRRYGQGRTILIDLLQAEGALVQARTDALSAALDYELAQAALKLAIGEGDTQ